MSEDKIISRHQRGPIDGVQGNRIGPPLGYAVQGSHDGETWEQLGDANETVDMGERRYARFVSVVKAEPTTQPETELPGLTNHRTTLTLNRMELITVLQRAGYDVPSNAGQEGGIGNGVMLTWQD